MSFDRATPTEGQASHEEHLLRSMNAVRAIVRALRRNARAIEVQTGISLAQLFVLQQLAERAAPSLNDLAARTSTHQSSVSVVVRRLVDRGLVTRAPAKADRRRVEIALTPTGRAMVDGAPETIQGQLTSGFRTLAAGDRRALAELIERWVMSASISLAALPMLGEDEPPRDRSPSRSPGA